MSILKYFKWDHLPPFLPREISKQYAAMAKAMDEELPDGPEKSVALRKLLESKDAAVRAALDND